MIHHPINEPKVKCVAAFVSLLAVALWASPASSNDTAAVQPNVLFVAIDDLRPALGCYGDRRVKSPHIDRLASQSRVFMRAYCNQAVCGPSRASLLTGRLPGNLGVWHNRNLFREHAPELVTMPQHFMQHGYRAISLGKVFSGNEQEEDPLSWSVPAILRRDDWKNYALRDGGNGKGLAFEAADVSDDGYPDGKLADLAIETLRDLKSNAQPFFLAVGFFKPHLPFNAPKKYWDLYDPAEFDDLGHQAVVTNAPPEAFHSHRELGGYAKIPKDEQVSPTQARDLRHGYHACVSYVDHQVGRLLDTLQQLELDDHTIVVLWGDHGFALGEANRWCKGTNFELDTRVPLIVRVPGISNPGLKSNALVELVDLYPTLAEAAGLPIPRQLDGQSFRSALENADAQGREVVFSQFARPFKPSPPEVMGYSIRTDSHRYTRWIDWKSSQTMAEEFYDYKNPSSVTFDDGIVVERENLAGQTALAQHMQSLSRRMDVVLRDRLNNASLSSLDGRPVQEQLPKNRPNETP